MSKRQTYAILTPSRGLIHSRTIEAVQANVDAAEADRIGWFFSHDLPIPDCDEKVAEMGMASGASLLWFIEEDVLPPPDALSRSLALLDEGWDVAAVDYPVGGSGWGCLVRDPKGDIEWCGLGCTLIRREVFEKLPQPWFSSDYQYVDFHTGRGWERHPSPKDNRLRWGGQDIYFCMNLRAAGFRIGQVPDMIAGQAFVEQLGLPGTNVGMHRISIRRQIKQQYPGPVAP